jgi:hypothetical protein
MASTPVISTDPSGNRVETLTYTTDYGKKIKITTDYGTIGFSKLFSKLRSYVIIFILFILFYLLGKLGYGLFGLGGKVGYGLYSVFSICSIAAGIYLLSTYDRKNIVTLEGAEQFPIPIVYGNTEGIIYLKFGAFMAIILAGALYTFLSFQKLFLDSPTNVIQAGGKRKKALRK